MIAAGQGCKDIIPEKRENRKTEPKAGWGSSRRTAERVQFPLGSLSGKPTPEKIRTATRAAAVTPARKRVDGQQVFRAVSFLR